MSSRYNYWDMIKRAEVCTWGDLEEGWRAKAQNMKSHVKTSYIVSCVYYSIFYRGFCAILIFLQLCKTEMDGAFHIFSGWNMIFLCRKCCNKFVQLLVAKVITNYWKQKYHLNLNLCLSLFFLFLY